MCDAEKRPFSGQRIVVTRSRQQAAVFCEQLAALGADPIAFPVIQFEPLPLEPLAEALRHIEQYDWIVFTSGNAVTFFFQGLEDFSHQLSAASDQPEKLKADSLKLIANSAIAASGSATAKKLAARGVTVDFIPDEFVGEELVTGLGDLTGKRVLLPRAKIGRPKIVTMLEEQGAVVADIPLYDTVTADPAPEALAELEEAELLTFTSPSSVRNFLKILRGADLPVPDLPVFCIGPITAAEAEKQGLRVTAVAEEYTIAGLIQVVVDYVNTELKIENG